MAYAHLLLNNLAAAGPVLVVAGRQLLALRRQLPDHAVCAILPDPGDGMARLVYDPEKPDALVHVDEMLNEWTPPRLLVSGEQSV